MKILMVSLTSCPIPSPTGQIFAPGLICYNLAKGLKSKGHQIKVFAAADSLKGEIDIEGSGINSTYSYQELSEEVKSYRIQQHEIFNIAAAFEEYNRGGYDLVHLNSFPISSYFSNFVSGPITCTHHGIPTKEHDLKTDIDVARQKKYFERINFVAISRKQRDIGRRYFNYKKIIHHGIDTSLFKFNMFPKDELLFVRRMVRGKNPDIAINVANKSKKKINLYGTVDRNSEYYKHVLSPLLQKESVNYLGCVAYEKMSKIYGNHKALIFPITWDEAFGLVMIEAMACGTPVIAFDRGAASEIITNGETGFLVKEGDLDGLVEAIKNIDQIDRNKCRENIEKNFSVEKMVLEYEKFFREIIENDKN